MRDKHPRVQGETPRTLLRAGHPAAFSLGSMTKPARTPERDFRAAARPHTPSERTGSRLLGEILEVFLRGFIVGEIRP